MYVRIYSREVIENHYKEEFYQDLAVISFCDRGTEPQDRVDYSSICDCVMYIEIDDLDYGDLKEEGYTYDTFFPEANEAAEFIIDAYKNGMNIICQCEYGESRSAGCAAAILEHFYHMGITVFTDYRRYPNKLIYHKIIEALNHREERVELHLYTNMSQTGGVSSAEEIILNAAEIEQKAVAITDNGVVQAFPKADRIAAEMSNRIKIIYGMEGNLCDCLPNEHTTLTILAKNQEGLGNLYRLVSWSHLENMIEGKPYITKEKLSEFRSGLLVGSGTEAGELYRAVSSGKTEGELIEIARFYDYLEICHTMPREAVFKIIHLGIQLDIPVCAVGNVYFPSCENEFVYLILTGDDPYHTDYSNCTGLLLYSTEGMLLKFKYLGEEKAYEVVVTNTNLIADMIDELRIIPTDIPMVIMKGADDFYKDDTMICAGAIESVSESEAEEHVREYAKKYDLDWNDKTIKFFTGYYHRQKKGVSKLCGTNLIFPKGYAAEYITPLQYADNGKDVVSHFDFSGFQNYMEHVSFPAVDHDRLSKLERLTGIKADDIPIDDPDIYGLFTLSNVFAPVSDEHEFLRGTLYIREFSNDTMDDIVFLCNPKNFEDLVKVCGLYYSLGGWYYNVRNLISGGTAELREVVSVRDDIVDHLVSRGVESAAAIEIMEITMFGTAKIKLLPEHIKTMLEHGVPEWYIESLKKFRFLFPRSVIAEYAKYMAGLAWYDLYYPREYYKVYFESKRELLDKEVLDIICGGADEIYKKICNMRRNMAMWGEKSELMQLLINAYEAICKGVELAGIV